MPDDDGLSQKAAKILSQFQGPVTLYSSKLKWSVILVILALTAALGGWSLWHDLNGADYWDVIGAAFLLIVGSFGVALIAYGLIANSIFMTLDSKGFTCGRAWSFTRCGWRDIDRFTTVGLTIRGLTLHRVAFDETARNTRFWSTLASAIYGRNNQLPDRYELRADELARLLTAWRERALGQSTQGRTAAAASLSREDQ